MKLNLFASTEIAPAFAECGLCLWDVGARGGMDPSFAPFAFAVDAVGFEPDPDAFESLSPSGGWRSEKFFETALGGPETGSTLHIPRDPVGASFLAHDPAIGARYGLENLFEIERRVHIPTVTMDRATAELGVPAPNLVKLDVEGLELDILKGGTSTLRGVVAIKLEAGFMRHRMAQPLAGDLIAFLENHGFCPVDIVDIARWRKRPWAGDPFSVRGQPPYSRGRLTQADLIFLREPDTVTAETAINAAMAAIGLGFFDHGLELLEAGPADNANEIRQAVYAASCAYGRARALEALRVNLSRTIQLCRSLVGGLNVPPPGKG